MSNVLTVTCGSCGAEESMDSVLMRMVDDDAVRQLVRDLLCSHYSVGRTWQVGQPQWTAAFAAVFAAVDKGTLKTPLPGNAYLYEVLTRQADASEGQAEAKAEQDRRNTPQRGALQVNGGITSLGALVAKDPALAAIEDRTRNAAKPDAATAARIAALLGKKTK